MGHVDARRLGLVVTEVGFRLSSSPDTVRAPDLDDVVQGFRCNVRDIFE
jgi:hypothetical protein